MKIYVVNMGSNSAENYHVDLVSANLNNVAKFVSEHLIYGDDHQCCNHIYNRVSDIQCWEDGELLFDYGDLYDDKINTIEEKETLTPEEILDEIQNRIKNINNKKENKK